MDKIKEKLLDDFTRANKDRKEKLAKKFGFSCADEYKAHLEDKEYSKPEEVKEAKVEVLTDIVIAFDTTGSMGAYIDAVKTHVKDLIPTLFKNTNNLQISIIAFGDYCDITKKVTNIVTDDLGKAYQSIDLTENTKALIKFVDIARDTSGGDSPEFYGLVLHRILNNTKWRPNSNKSVLLIADDIDHGIGYKSAGFVNKFNYTIEAPLYKEAGIRVDTLSIHGTPWYKELSLITNGIYMEFKSANKTSQLLEGYTYARTGATASFTTSYNSVVSSGDEELIGVYKQLGTL
jgi:hypothetical protein